MKILALILILLSAYYCFKKQYILVFIYSFFSSTSDSASLKFLMDNSLSGFSYSLQALLFCASIISIVQYKKSFSFSRGMPYYLNGYNFLLVYALIIFFVKEMEYNGIIKTIALYVSFITDYSIASFVIILCFVTKIDLKKYLYALLLSHCLLAFFTIYGPYIGLPWFGVFNYDLYDENAGAYLTRSYLTPFLMRGDIMTIMQDKWQIHVGSCFGNGNILGVYSGSLVVLSTLDLLERKKVFISIVSLLFGLILWMDAGTRAPFFALLIFLLYYSYRHSNRVVFIPLLTIFITFSMTSVIDFFSYSIEKSTVSREEMVSYEWEFFISHFLIGDTSVESLPKSPHQLWLLYGTKLGIIGLLFSFIYFYIIPLANYMKVKKNKDRMVCILLLLLMISNTNNFTALVLYNTLFCYYISLSAGETENIYERELLTIAK